MALPCVLVETIACLRWCNVIIEYCRCLNRMLPSLPQFEMEEESIVNRLQRQLQAVTSAYRALEARCEAAGMSPRADAGPHIDTTTE